MALEPLDQERARMLLAGNGDALMSSYEPEPFNMDDRAMVDAVLSGGGPPPPMQREKGRFEIPVAPQPDPLLALASEDPRSVIAAQSKMPVMQAGAVPGLATPAPPVGSAPAAAAVKAPAPRRAGTGGKTAPEAPPNLDEWLQQYAAGGPGEEGEETYGNEQFEGSSPVTKGLLPAGEQRKESTFKIDPLAAQDLEDMRGEQDAAERTAATADEDARRMTRWGEKTGQGRKEEIQLEGVKQDQERTQRYQSLLAKHERAAKEIADQEITEPSRWTGDVGTDVLNWIGTFLLGVGAGPEAMQKKIQTEIDRDFAVQKERIAKKRADWETDGLLLEQTAKIYDTEAAQEAAAREIALQGIDAQIKRFAEYSQDPAVKARAESLLVQNEQQRFMAKLALEQATRDEVMRSYAPPAPVKGGGGPDALADLKKRNEYMRERGWDRKLYVPGAGGYALREADVEELKNGAIAKRGLVSALSRMIRINDMGVSGKMPMSDARKEMDAAWVEATGEYNKVKKFGAMDTGTQDLIGGAIPKPSTISAGASASYKTVAQMAENGFRTAMRERGLIEGPAPDDIRGDAKPLDVRPEGQ